MLNFMAFLEFLKQLSFMALMDIYSSWVMKGDHTNIYLWAIKRIHDHGLVNYNILEFGLNISQGFHGQDQHYINSYGNSWFINT